MCGRYVLPYTWQEIHDHLDGFIKSMQVKPGDVVTKMPPRYNIAPTQPIFVMYEEAGQTKANMMRWGLVPSWVKDPREFPLIINARFETIREKPAFRGSLRHHRCIVPASGYYEWRKGADGKKQPYFITRKDGEPMIFAGVYSDWMGPSGEEIDTAAIITVPANPEMKHLHDRTPAIISKQQVRDWLDVGNVDAKEAYKMLGPLPEGVAAFYPVSTRVGSIKNDDENLVTPMEEEKPEPAKKASGQLDLF